MIHKITRQYIMDNCSGKDDLNSTKAFILDLIKDHLLAYLPNIIFIDTRLDMYLYESTYWYNPDSRHKIEKAYIFKDTFSGFYLYFFYMSPISDNFNSFFNCGIYFTMSKKYDTLKNVLRQEGMPKIFGKAKIKAVSSFPDVKYHKNECYAFLLGLCLKFSIVGDFYFVTNGRSFSFIVDSSYGLLERYDNENASYFIYDVSSPYHAKDKHIVSIHGSKTYHFRTGTSQKYVIADVADYKYEWAADSAYQDTNTNYGCLAFVSCDTFDLGFSGYYSTDFTLLSSIHRYKDITNLYICDADVELQETIDPSLQSPYEVPRKDCSSAVPRIYEEPDTRDMFVGAMVSYFDGYATRRAFQTPTAAEIMYRTNDDFNYLDTNSGTNYYSGMLSTLDNSTVAIPNFVSILREPYELGTMSPVQESTFMYLVDMSNIKTGDIVEVVDNSGNKIKLACFPTSVNEIIPPGDKLFGIGLRLPEEYYTENYINLEAMDNNRKDKSIELMPVLNSSAGIRAYLGNVEFLIYPLGTILLNFSYKKVESIQVDYTTSRGSYIKTVTWKRKDFMDRMRSGAVFDLLRKNDTNDDYWFIDPRRSDEMLLACNNRNCGIVGITCTRRK